MGEGNPSMGLLIIEKKKKKLGKGFQWIHRLFMKAVKQNLRPRTFINTKIAYLVTKKEENSFKNVTNWNI